MPNWVYNVLAIKGSKKDLVDFINDGLKRSFAYSRNKKQITNFDEETIKFLTDLHDYAKEDKHALSLNAYIPMPRTYILWDTTNTMKSFDSYICCCDKFGRSLPDYKSDTYKAIKEYVEEHKEELEKEKNAENAAAKILFPEKIAEYEKYVEGYENAVAEQKIKYDAVGWYDWRCKNYGVKWNALFSNFEMVNDNEDNCLITFKFETAWSGPFEWVKTIQERYPALTFGLLSSEEQYSFCGYLLPKKGMDFIGEVDYDRVVEHLKDFAGYSGDEEDFYDIVWCEMNEEISALQDEFGDYMLNEEVKEK